MGNTFQWGFDFFFLSSERSEDLLPSRVGEVEFTMGELKEHEVENGDKTLDGLTSACAEKIWEFLLTSITSSCVPLESNLPISLLLSTSYCVKVAVVFNGPAGKGLIGELKADCSISFIFPLTVAVKSMKHGRGWEGSVLVSDVAAGASMPRLSFFFFFFFHGFAPTQLWYAPIWPESGRIRLYRPATEEAGISLESCRNSRNWLWMRPKHPKSVLP